MKRLIIITLLLFMAAFSFSQTNATFNNLDVRNTSKFRGLIYPFGASAKTPMSTSDEVLMVELPSFKLIRVDFSEFADSITSLMVGLWYLDGDTIINVSDYKVRMTDEVYIYPLPPEATKTGRMMHINQYGQVEWMSPATLVDTLQILMPQYWTFVDSGTDTLKNNVALSGVVAIKGNLELETTNAAATNGIVKQDGVNLIHTYHEKSNTNLFIGQGAGNFTADSSFNIGIGYNTLSLLTSGYNNTAIGYQALSSNTSGINNTAIGWLAASSNVGCRFVTAIGYEAMRYANDAASGFTYNTAIGYGALRGSPIASNNTGFSNTAIGYLALDVITTANKNTAVGVDAGGATTIGVENTFIGYKSAEANIQGINNVAIGANSLYSNGDNDGTIAIGYNAMYYADSRTTGERITYNTAIGYEAMRGSTTAANNTGQYNTATGYRALDGMTSGSFNTVYGYDAGGGITTGDSNILIGTSAGAQLTTESYQLYIDNTNTTTPLIHGNMSTDYVTINGQFTTDNSFGELFEDAANVTATVATYKTIASLQSGQYNEATLTDSSMTITQAGTYLVNYSSSFTHSVNNTLCHISLFVNDTEDTSLEAERKIGTAGDFGSMSGTALVTLTANAVLKLKAKSDNDGDLTVNHLNFNCTRIK